MPTGLQGEDPVWTAVFAPLDALGRADAVAQRLADAIGSGLLWEGVKLPSEAELGKLFGVATVTAREALETLRQAGVIETRRGRGGGSFVIAPEDPARGGFERLTAMSVVDIRDLALHYRVISAAAAERAASFISEDESVELTRLVAEIPSDAHGVRVEYSLRIDIAAASRSPRLAREQTQLLTEFLPLLWAYYGDATSVQQVMERHRRAVAAITTHDADRARDEVNEYVADLVHGILALRAKLRRREAHDD